jgi:hypothetical protein
VSAKIWKLVKQQGHEPVLRVTSRRTVFVMRGKPGATVCWDRSMVLSSLAPLDAVRQQPSSSSSSAVNLSRSVAVQSSLLFPRQMVWASTEAVSLLGKAWFAECPYFDEYCAGAALLLNPNSSLPRPAFVLVLQREWESDWSALMEHPWKLSDARVRPLRNPFYAAG